MPLLTRCPACHAAYPEPHYYVPDKPPLIGYSRQQIAEIRDKLSQIKCPRCSLHALESRQWSVQEQQRVQALPPSPPSQPNSPSPPVKGSPDLQTATGIKDVKTTPTGEMIFQFEKIERLPGGGVLADFILPASGTGKQACHKHSSSLRERRRLREMHQRTKSSSKKSPP